MLKHILAAGAALALAVTSADATVLLGLVNTAGQTVQPGVTNLQLLPGVTAGTFTVAKAGTYIVTFSGECAVGGASKTLFLGIFVDNKPVDPPLPQLSFCSSDATPAVDNWASHAVNVPVRLAAGTHSVQVRVQLADGVTAWVDDFSTLVHD